MKVTENKLLKKDSITFFFIRILGGKNQQINVVLKEEWWYTLENIITFKRNSEETLDSMIQTQFSNFFIL